MKLYERNAKVFLVLLQLLHFTLQATIGDGTISLYSGRHINSTDTRGSCLADGFRYSSETSIPRDHPCHYCICYQTQITCYWKTCAAPPIDCTVMEFPNVCNPSLYVCEIPARVRPEPVLEFGARLNAPRRKRKLWRKRLAKRSVGDGKEALPVEEGFSVEFKEAWEQYQKFASRKKRAIDDSFSSEERNILQRDTSCTVLGVKYNLGEVIGVTSDVCMECRCAAGKMFCSPKCCFVPAPFSMNFDGSNSIFIRTRSRGSGRAPNPLHYIRNQLEKGPFK